MRVPTNDQERFALLAKLSAEAWLQSRAALLITSGNTPDVAASTARAAFDDAFGGCGIDISYFHLESR